VLNLMRCTALAVLVLLAGCERKPSCAERGGRLVQTGLQPMLVGKAWVLVAQYRCEGAAWQ
jgi:hypothetical protein